jgi:glycerol-3-phosphate cytidylyltransferase
MMKLRPARYRSVLTYGAFDLFGPDQIRFLQELTRLGSDVIVGCRTDGFSALCGQPCNNSFGQRRNMLESCRFVSKVITQDSFAQIRTDIVNHDICALIAAPNCAGPFDGVQDIAQILHHEGAEMSYSDNSMSLIA